MKTTIITLLATIVISLAASAAPDLLFETAFTYHAKDGKDVLTTRRVTVESGKPVIIRIGTTQYTLTPTLLKDGTVELGGPMEKGQPAELGGTLVLGGTSTIAGDDKKSGKLFFPTCTGKLRSGHFLEIREDQQIEWAISLSLVK